MTKIRPELPVSRLHLGTPTARRIGLSVTIAAAAVIVSVTLRPEGTAPIARAYVEHGLAQEPQPVKAYTIAPMYRYGRPGRGAIQAADP